MKLLQFSQGGRLYLGIKTGQGILDVEKASTYYDLPVPGNMEQAIAGGANALTGLQQLVGAVAQERDKQEFFLPEDTIEFAPCVSSPQKVLCVGLNYIDHAEESKLQVPATPVLFSKFNNALAAHKQAIQLPKSAGKFDYEAELVIVMGKDAKDVSVEQALSHVFGYTVGNDFSARDLQMRTGQWLLGKTCDGFAPLGPYVVTADELTNPQQLSIKCKVNGVLRQSATTASMIFDCATIISYISQHMTLKAGDIIFTGTPEGVILGYPQEQQQWLKAGDEIAISIEKVGTLVNSLR